MLGYLAAARQINEKRNGTMAAYFQRHFDDLVAKNGYAQNLRNLRIANPADAAFFDGNLGKYALRNLLYFAYGRGNNDTDAAIDAAFEQWFVLGERAQLTPAIFLYLAWANKAGRRAPAALLDQGVSVLKDWPLESIQWPVKNSDRWDIELNPEYPAKQPTLRSPLRRSEICAPKWSHAAFMVDGCSGLNEANPKDFLEAFWSGVYIGLIKLK